MLNKQRFPSQGGQGRKGIEGKSSLLICTFQGHTATLLSCWEVGSQTKRKPVLMSQALQPLASRHQAEQQPRLTTPTVSPQPQAQPGDTLWGSTCQNALLHICVWQGKPPLLALKIRMAYHCLACLWHPEHMFFEIFHIWITHNKQGTTHGKTRSAFSKNYTLTNKGQRFCPILES